MRQISFEWKAALRPAILISVFVLGLLYYWFAVADRYAIFLYGHLGATPFDAVTSSRYWMSGLVASGAVMVGYTIVNWLLGRIHAWREATYSPPPWWQVWLVCAPPLAIGIPLITMNVNWPTLPPYLAAACVVATLGGLALALMPGLLAAQRPENLAWLTLDGLGLMPGLLLLKAIELPGRGLFIDSKLAYLIGFGSPLVGIVWLGMLSGLRRWRGVPPSGAGALLAAGFCFSYLLLPLLHHLFTPAAHRYISTASNFFAFHLETQLLIFLIAALTAIGITRFREFLQQDRIA